MENQVWILRSLPGAGKTTRSNQIIKEYQGSCWREEKPLDTNIDKYPYPYLYLSADDYLQSGSVYCWDKDLLHLAHKRCQKLFTYGLDKSVPLIIVDNTNTTWSEYKYYVSLAEAYDYKIQIENIFDAGLTNEQLQARCKHPVPLLTYEKMRARYQQQSFTSVEKAEEFFNGTLGSQ